MAALAPNMPLISQGDHAGSPLHWTTLAIGSTGKTGCFPVGAAQRIFGFVAEPMKSGTITVCPEITIRMFIVAVLYACLDMTMPKKAGISSRSAHKVTAAYLAG